MTEGGPRKTKRTVSLDADLVAAVGDGNLSAEVNEALRLRVRARQRTENLGRYLDELEAAEGSVDPDGVRSFLLLLGGDEAARAA